MSKEFLERLYWTCADETSHMADGLNLGELYEHIQDTATVDHLLADKLEKLKLTPENKEVMESYFSEVSWAYERQGFINGFRLGMKLAQELSL